jgi:hypothetical protein
MLLFAAAVQADAQLPEPGWTVHEAREAAAQVDALAAVKPLFELARAGRDEDLLRALVALADRADWSEPARERVLHTFALGLADLPPGAVSREVTVWLLGYQPRTLVPHVDYPLAGVPLYGIGSAAAGALHSWERQTAAAEASQLLQAGVEDWLDAWLTAGPARQLGFVDSLDVAGAESLRRLTDQVLERLPAEPRLTPVAARAGILLTDPAIFERTVAAGGGPDLAPALRSAARAFDETERADLLLHAIRHAPAVNASLAIAELAPGLLHQPEVMEKLFAMLADRALGSAAALTLANSKNPAVRDRLEELADSGAGLQARRAAIAVETARHNAGGNRQ